MGKEKNTRFILYRVMAFLVLLAAVDIWSNHHFGFGFKNPGVFAGVSSILTGALVLLEKVLPKSEQANIRAALFNVLGRGLSFPALVIGYLVFVIAAMNFSTVRVTFAPETSGAKATLIPAQSHSESIKSKEIAPGIVHFVVSTNPFGRMFYLEVDGYMPETLTVFSLRGLSIIADQDLRVKPTVLIRPTPLGLRDLEDGGSIVISLVNGPNSPRKIAEHEKFRGSFLIGRHKWIPSERYERWRLDLDLMDPKRSTHSRTLLEWGEPQRLAPGFGIEPRQRILVEIKTALGDVTEKIEFTVGDERLIDVLLARMEE